MCEVSKPHWGTTPIELCSVVGFIQVDTVQYNNRYGVTPMGMCYYHMSNTSRNIIGKGSQMDIQYFTQGANCNRFSVQHRFKGNGILLLNWCQGQEQA